MLHVLALAWLTAFQAPTPSSATPPGEVVAGELGARIDAYLTRCVPFGFSGAVLLVKDGALVLCKGYGIADRTSGASCTPATLFDLGDVTMAFTAVATLRLEELKKLKLRDTLDKLVPGVPDDKKKLQLVHLLTHTSGLPMAVKGVGPKLAERDDLIRTVLRLPLADPPGTDYRYSRLGYGLLAAILEGVAHKPFEELVYEFVLAPAGLTSTGFRLDGKCAATRAARGRMQLDVPPEGSLSTGLPAGNGDPRDRELADERELATEGWYSWGLRGAGGVLSSVEDLWRFEQALHGDTLLSKNSRKRLFTPALEDYACAWSLRHGERKTSWYEVAGWSQNGFEAQVARFPNDDGFAAILCNSTGLANAVKVAVHRLLFGREAEPPPATVALAPEALAAFAGEYEGSDGAQWRVVARDGGLALEARTPKAFELFAPKLNGHQKHSLRQSEEFVAGLRAGELAALDKLDEWKRLQWFRDLWRDLVAHHGALREATLLGLASFSEAQNLVVVRLDFERGEELLSLRWGDEYLFGLDLDPPYANRLRLVPESQESFLGFDLARGQRTGTAHFDAGGELTIERAGAQSVAHRRR
jgi:CubicO group peptidase (beta-lactamase class C family)